MIMAVATTGIDEQQQQQCELMSMSIAAVSAAAAHHHPHHHHRPQQQQYDSSSSATSTVVGELGCSNLVAEMSAEAGGAVCQEPPAVASHQQATTMHTNNSSTERDELELKTDECHQRQRQRQHQQQAIKIETVDRPQADRNCCASCRMPIRDRFIFSVIERNFHKTCVRCSDCAAELSDRCFALEGRLYCRLDYWRRFGPKCSACQELIKPTELVQKVKQNLVYHLSCFFCQDCKRHLQTGEQLHLVDERRLLCSRDYLLNTYTQPAFHRQPATICHHEAKQQQQQQDENYQQLRSPLLSLSGVVESVASASNSSVRQLATQNNTPKDQQKPKTAEAGAAAAAAAANNNKPTTNKQQTVIWASGNKAASSRASSSKQTFLPAPSASSSSESNASQHQQHTTSTGRIDGRRGPKRPRTILTTSQRKAFRSSFDLSQKPCRKVREALAKETGLSVRIVQVWFQNQRAKLKKMQRKQMPNQHQQQISGQHSLSPGSAPTNTSNGSSSHLISLAAHLPPAFLASASQPAGGQMHQPVYRQSQQQVISVQQPAMTQLQQQQHQQQHQRRQPQFVATGQAPMTCASSTAPNEYPVASGSKLTGGNQRCRRDRLSAGQRTMNESEGELSRSVSELDEMSDDDDDDDDEDEEEEDSTSNMSGCDESESEQSEEEDDDQVDEEADGDSAAAAAALGSDQEPADQEEATNKKRRARRSRRATETNQTNTNYDAGQNNSLLQQQQQTSTAFLGDQIHEEREEDQFLLKMRMFASQQAE